MANEEKTDKIEPSHEPTEVAHEQAERQEIVGKILSQMMRDLNDEGLQEAGRWKETYEPVITEAYLKRKVREEDETSKRTKIKSFFKTKKTNKWNVNSDGVVATEQGIDPKAFTKFYNDAHLQKKLEVINEFCSVLQAGLKSARFVVDPNSRVRHDRGGGYIRLNRFLANECAKALIRNPDALDKLVARWNEIGDKPTPDQEVKPLASTGEGIKKEKAASIKSEQEDTIQESSQRDSKDEKKKNKQLENLEKCAMAASAVCDIANVAIKTNWDKHRTRITVARRMSIVGGIVEMFAFPTHDDKTMLHSSLRKQFKHFVPNFITATPPLGFDWHVPRVIDDLSQLPPNCKPTSLRFGEYWLGQLTQNCREGNKKLQAIATTWNDLHTNGNKSTLPDPLKEHIQTAEKRALDDTVQVLQDSIVKEAERWSAKNYSKAYVVYEVKNEAGNCQYYRVPWHVLAKGNPTTTNTVFSKVDLEKMLYIAISSRPQWREVRHYDERRERYVYRSESHRNPLWQRMYDHHLSEGFISADGKGTINLDPLTRDRSQVSKQMQKMAQLHELIDEAVQAISANRDATLRYEDGHPKTPRPVETGQAQADDLKVLQEEVKSLESRHKAAIKDFNDRFEKPSLANEVDSNSTGNSTDSIDSESNAREKALLSIKKLREQLNEKRALETSLKRQSTSSSQSQKKAGPTRK